MKISGCPIGNRSNYFTLRTCYVKYMKRCPKCETEKLLECFWKSSKHKDGLQTYCKECSTKRRVQYFQENKEQESKLRNLRSKEYKEWYLDLKRGPCSDCGKSYHPVAMQWHHRSDEIKLYNLGYMKSRKMARKKILEEIAKCDLVCANCHAIRHFANDGVW